MTFQAWGAAAAIVAASLLLGAAANRVGVRCRAAAPAVGFSLLILLSSVAIKLPGDAGTAAAALLAALLVAAAILVWRRRRIRFPGTTLAVVGLAGFGAAIPFIANGRVGLLGVSLDNDTASHLEYAEGLRSAITRSLYGVPSGYPLGPHSLADALSTGLGVRLDLAFTGVLIATVIITALVAASALRFESWWKRILAGALGSLIYLVAAYYAEGSFKEPIMGVLLLAMVLQLEEVLRSWRSRSSGRLIALVPVAVLVGAMVYVYGYLGLAWPVLALAIWLLAEAVARPSRVRRWREELRDLLPPVLLAGAALLLILLPNAGRILSLISTFGISPSSTGAITTSNMGNLAYPLSPYEALGLWNNIDFRLLPPNLFLAGQLSALAAGVLAFGLAWSVIRRELLLPAAVAACALIYWRSSHGQSPYVTAKALAIAGPVVAVTEVRGLLGSSIRPLSWRLAVPRSAVAALFLFLAAHSSYSALANEPVWTPESTSELLTLDKLTRGQPVLFLGATDYADWLFHDSQMSALAPDSISLEHAGPRPTKLNTYATALDFDSINPANINQFPWVITTNTDYASQPPAGFRLVKQLPMYQAWARVGSVAARGAIDPVGAPGAVLNCRTRAGRALSRSPGTAAVMTPPVSRTLGATGPGGVISTSMKIPAGRWQLSMQYTSAVDLQVSVEGRRWSMPAYLDRPGPVFAVGSITSVGNPVTLTIRADRPSAMTGDALFAQVSALYAVHLPDTRTLIPLRRSCGRYIDWYRN